VKLPISYWRHVHYVPRMNSDRAWRWPPPCNEWPGFSGA